MFAAAVLEAMLTRLVRLFLGADGDVGSARQAAHLALLAYHPRNEAELTLAAEIISFSLHALDALSRSSDPDLTVNQLCRLRSNAVSLSREAHKAQRKLDQMQKAALAPEVQIPEAQTPEAPIPEAQAPEIIAEPAEVTPAARPAGQTWTQAYHQRQREKRLANRARKVLMQNTALSATAVPFSEPAGMTHP